MIFFVRKAWLKLAVAISAIRQGDGFSARASACPRSKQRAGEGAGVPFARRALIRLDMSPSGNMNPPKWLSPSPRISAMFTFLVYARLAVRPKRAVSYRRLRLQGIA
jgi:hypothetical protein